MNAQTQNMPAQSPAKAFQVYMNKYKSQLEMALPKHLTVDRMMRLSLTAFSQNPNLQKCSSKSIFSSIIIASQLGLEPGINGQGYLVPYSGTCTFIPGWKGLVDLAQRGGRASVWTGAVYEGDEFDYMLGDAPYCRHKPCGEFDNDKLTHVYAIGRVKDSEMPIIEVWPVKKVHAHFVKTVVKGLQPNHYSKKHFEAYARKVALLQVLKYMPQSIELSNAMDVSHAQESGKGVTIDGDFVNVDNSNEDQNSQYSTQNEAQNIEHEQQPTQHVQEQEIEYAPSFEQIKRGVLTAKSPAHLDVMEEQAMDHADKDERKQLMQLIKAQGQKFQSAAEVATAKKPEPQHQEAPPVEAEQPKKPTSTEIRKEYLDQIEGMTHVKDLETIIPWIDGHEVLTTAHKTYLVNSIKNKIEDINKASAVQETKSVHAVDDIKSQAVANGLKIQITDAPDIDQLTVIAQTIRESKEKLTMDHMSDVLQVYGARKTFLENQQDMFADVNKAWIDSAIERIENARNQDDINAEYIDPMYEEQSDKDKQRLNIAAQKREAEILG